MFSGDWTPPCGSCCTKKYASLVQIPWRVFCKKGCNTDGDTWEECIGKCTEICYKDPVLEDRQWSAYIDRSPGQDSYSLECFNACVSGCGYRVGYIHTSPYPLCSLLLGLISFEIPTEKVEEIKPNRPSKPPPPEVKPTTGPDSAAGSREDVPCTSA
ncbi:uncharacterized protein LOC112899000 isoform X1 [Panicum hallii]|uniref:uncharacterized protein LOC112899000 isoform X1 n=1 Tax=Panicum hallii TaxID=206008 RepID=UPI000DF4D8C4|nr:uncharacterized protein LOC112899000 isoform X1 [Panicum hallii]